MIPETILLLVFPVINGLIAVVFDLCFGDPIDVRYIILTSMGALGYFLCILGTRA